jgi:hydroxymethylpyrimidine/phosphomethylpyrimidine kinase
VTAVALTIGGSDPSGGAGIQADLKTFHNFGVYGEAVLTLLTVQNTTIVARVETVPPDLVREQIDAVVADIPPAAAKTGALGTAAIVEAVAAAAATFHFPLVIDPVMFSKHGAKLLSEDAERVLKRCLIPEAYLVTPNLPEAQALAGIEMTDEADILNGLKRIRNLGCSAVLIKGGHAVGEPADYLLDADGVQRFSGTRIVTQHTHGTGCTYSAAITACLSLGMPLREAVATSKRYIQNAIATAPGLGSGSGPVNHFARWK